MGEIISHLDNRSDPQQSEILKNHGKLILSLNGSLPNIAPRLLWLKENVPASFRKFKRRYLLTRS